MNREIKFRVWSNLEDKYLSWDEIWYSILKVPANTMPDQKEEIWISFLGMVLKSPNDKYIAQQFIGLNDKNNNPIYEGDILKIELESLGAVAVLENELPSTETGYVFYHEESCSFRVVLKNGQYCMSGGKNLEIIGNAMENGDLIK